MTKEICICAAVKTTEGEVIRGHRHVDCLAAIRRIGANASAEQGFVTSSNRFVSRVEGLELQLSAGMESASPDGYRNKLLFSEDLY